MVAEPFQLRKRMQRLDDLMAEVAVRKNPLFPYASDNLYLRSTKSWVTHAPFPLMANPM